MHRVPFVGLTFLPLSLPEVRLGEIDQILAAAAHHGLEHVEREALGHVDRDAGRNGKHHAAHDRVDQSRSVVSEGFCAISMKPSAPLLNTTTLTGRLC